MSKISKKVCMLGPFAVGKTSLVRRFVESIFSDKYHTTIGVKISKRVVNLHDMEILNMIWDVEGTDDFTSLKPSHLRGAAGILLVVDGTRPKSVEGAKELKLMIDEHLGKVPLLLLVNKCDLRDEWKIQGGQFDNFIDDDNVIHTSAKTGENVESAFTRLNLKMMDAKAQEE
ncbi:Rab family GTPase [Maricurvus nonylphenolicus]|uniref:Rab family GTPase n=1 Tax=Maricurvus nonylphenolicus TaxID=1008307 RepID=UPI0036F3B6AB